jgi:uncharacterized secreted protein with C-terminal beta-propeller domain
MKRLTMFVAALMMLVTACSSADDAGTTTSLSAATSHVATTRPPTQAQPVSYGLQAFTACDDFLSYVKSHAVDLVGPWGFDYGYWGGPVMAAGDVRLEASTTAAASSDAAVPAAAPQQGVDYSGTNLQEIGVDEPDLVKTDGERIIAISNNTLYVVDVTGGEPRLAGQITLDENWPEDMFLSGDKVLVMGYGDNSYPTPLVDTPVADSGYYVPSTPITTLTEIDISNIEKPAVERVIYVDGSKVSARMVDGTVRLVVSSYPTGLEFKYPDTNGLKAQRDAEAYNRQVVLDSTIDNWVPYYVIEDAKGNVLDEGSLLSCTSAHHPEEFSGIEMLNIVTIDMSEDLAIRDAVGVLAEGDIVYSSTDAMYVASAAWRNWSVLSNAEAEDTINKQTTDIHKFDISDPNKTTYLATGRVDGFMLSQWSMDEYRGRLRVATTSSPAWWSGATRNSESFVTVLEEKDGELVKVGQVGGIGEGEQIYAVRFFDDVGYVVTYQQTDPLYTIDLSDPTSPEVAGELDLLGYSAYLHPVGDGLLLGVGQDATEQGRTLGTQVSLYDVSDPAKPTRIQNYTFDNGYSSVEWDHHAFLYWPQTGLTVIPVSAYTWDEKTQTESGFVGAIALEVTEDGINEIGRITQGTKTGEADMYWWGPTIDRSLVIGDSLYTYSADGLLQSDLETVEPGTFVGFGQ